MKPSWLSGAVRVPWPWYYSAERLISHGGQAPLADWLLRATAFGLPLAAPLLWAAFAGGPGALIDLLFSYAPVVVLTHGLPLVGCLCVSGNLANDSPVLDRQARALRRRLARRLCLLNAAPTGLTPLLGALLTGVGFHVFSDRFLPILVAVSGVLWLGTPVLLFPLMVSRVKQDVPTGLSARCPRCAYPLHGLPEPRCPECGTPFDPALLEPTSPQPEAQS